MQALMLDCACDMSRLTSQDRVAILTTLSEGMGINAAYRLTGASKNTVLKLMAYVGQACALYQDQAMRKLTIINPAIKHSSLFLQSGFVSYFHN